MTKRYDEFPAILINKWQTGGESGGRLIQIEIWSGDMHTYLVLPEDDATMLAHALIDSVDKNIDERKRPQ